VKVASPVREGVVGNVPKGNALATYFTAAVAQRQIEQARRSFLWIRMLSSQETLLNALCDLVTNAPELRHTTIERSFLHA
jgi:hypothetical protein